MIETFGSYKTKDGRKVVIIASKMVNDKKVFVGLIEGTRAYAHWNEDGTRFGENDSKSALDV